MSAYDLEEQEQLAELKAFWKQHGILIIVCVSAAALAFLGVQGWQGYQRSQATQAGVIYGAVQRAAGANDAAKVRAGAGELIEQYPRTLYAVLGALIAAKVDFDAGDLKNARAKLQWVVDNARDPEVQALARMRLAIVMLDDRAYDDALKVLAATTVAPFEPLFAELRGDVYVAQGKGAEARAAYQSALDALTPEDNFARERIQMKRDALGSG
jgi:predicted negative regulator of RcsB-dependent stress response